MSLTTLVIVIAVIAIVLTVVMGMGRKIVKNYLVTFFQNFTGVLFLISGFVKAVDPLGTAFKMEQYFAEFESTFAGTKAAFLAPLFPTLAEYAIGFSVFMIVLEIALGLMLLIGFWRKFTAWAFFLLVFFFLFLTGFTFLTGYVPEGVNFFQFGQWGPYVETNMKVTDCGCFGDFLKLEPFTSFMKDVVLLAPALVFLFMTSQMHQVFSATARRALTGLTLAATTLYCFSNYVWDIPHADFRPFYEGNNIAEQKAAEEEAAINVEVIAYRVTNKATGETKELPYDEYLANYQDYPSEEWELEQVKSEPEIEPTKISDFEVSDLEGNDVTYDILEHTGKSLMIIAYKLYGSEETQTMTVPDSVFVTDTVITEVDTVLSRRLVRVDQKTVETTVYNWDEDYLAKWRSGVHAFAQAGHEAGLKVYAIIPYASTEKVQSFKAALGADYDFYMADDILLKTIIRSNPGMVYLENGTIIKKWHRRKLPDFAAFQLDYL